MEFEHALGVEVVGALLLPEADGKHFHQARFDRSAEIGVRLDPPDGDRGIGVVGVLVEPHRHVAFDEAEFHRVHARADRAAHRRFGDPVVRDECGLVLRDRPCMAAHRRDDERLGSAGLHRINGGADDFVDTINPAAARGDRHRHARLDGVAHAIAGEFGAHGGIDVVDARRDQLLPDRRPHRKRPALEDLQTHRATTPDLVRLAADPSRTASVPHDGAARAARCQRRSPTLRCRTPACRRGTRSGRR